MRLLSVIFVLWLAATLSFSLLYIIPGDPAEAALGQTIVSQEALEIRREALGLNLPLHMQYWRFLTNALSGDFGVSWMTGQSVGLMVNQQLASTLELALVGILISLVVGGVLGFVSGASTSRLANGVSTAVVILLIAVPVMFSATLLLWTFSGQDISIQLLGQGGASRLLLPALVIGAAGAGTLAMPVAVRLNEIRYEPFILAVRARGASQSRLVMRHMTPYAVLAALDIAALMIGYLLGGTVITEMIFARPGLGRLLLSAVLNQDVPVVQAVVVLSAFVYTVVNIAADILRGWIDPRARII